MSLEGHGRNKIAQLLQQQGIHVSEGSVGNIIRGHTREHGHIQETPIQPQPEQVNNSVQANVKNSIEGTEKPEPDMQEQKTPPSPNNNSKYSEDKIIPSMITSHPGDWQVVNSNNNSVTNPNPNSVTNPNPNSVINRTVPLELPSSPQQQQLCIGGPLLSFLTKNKVVQVNSTTTTTAATRTSPETEMRVDINNDVNYLNNHVNSKTSTTEEEEKEFEEYQYQQHHQPQSSLPDSENPSRSTTIEDWDVQVGWSRMLNEVRTAKKRHDELLLIEQKWQEINQERTHDR
jgi:hypothetical protein